MRKTLVALASLALLPSVLAADVLKTNGFSNCNNGSSTVKVNNVDISFDKSTGNIDFDVSGTSTQQQFVTAELIVTAYGVKVYNNSFDPCDDSTKVDQLCPGMSHEFVPNTPS
jgi:spore coat protein U-like protein